MSTEIPYKTEFVEYPDIAPTLKAFHITPHEDNDPPYTIPAIKIGKEYLMDSTVIVKELERRYPKPSLKLDASKLTRVVDVIVPVAVTLRPVSRS
jgi:glutathione S-transferase